MISPWTRITLFLTFHIKSEKSRLISVFLNTFLHDSRCPVRSTLNKLTRIVLASIQSDSHSMPGSFGV